MSDYHYVCPIHRDIGQNVLELWQIGQGVFCAECVEDAIESGAIKHAERIENGAISLSQIQAFPTSQKEINEQIRIMETLKSTDCYSGTTIKRLGCSCYEVCSEYRSNTIETT